VSLNAARITVRLVLNDDFRGLDVTVLHRKSKPVGNRSVMSPDVGRADGVVLSGPAGVGAELRAARERLGWALADVAAGLRIRLPYLEALEAGRLGDLPAAAYALGFLRTYAAALGLDAEEQVSRFKASDRDITRKVELEFPVPAPERGVPAGAVVLLAVILTVGAYVGWYRLSGDGRLPAEVVQPVPERLAPLAEQAIPLTPPSRPAAPRETPATPALAAIPPSGPPPIDMPSVPPTSAAAAMLMPRAPTAGAASAANPSQGSEDGRIVLRARADTWLQVRERGGSVLLNRVLHGGESWPVPARPNLLLSTGNAGGTDLVVDGTVAPGVGGAGAVRRDLPLDADAIKDGKLPAQIQAAAQPAPAQVAAPRPSPQ